MSKGQRKGKRQPKPRPKQTAQAPAAAKASHPVRTTLKILSILAVAALVIYLAVVWNSVPAEVPTTFDADGNAIAFTSKSYLLAFPIIGGLLCLMVAIMANDTRVWRLPFKVRDEHRKTVDALMNNVMVLLTLELELIFLMLSVSMATSWNPGSTILVGSLVIVVGTVVVGFLLAYQANGGKQDNNGSSGRSSFSAPPSNLGRRL